MNIFQLIAQYKNNPQQILQRFNIPKEYNSPDSVAQYLMQSGKVNQTQIDQAREMYKSIFGN